MVGEIVKERLRQSALLDLKRLRPGFSKADERVAIDSLGIRYIAGTTTGTGIYILCYE
jgi:hypothetical protein